MPPAFNLSQDQTLQFNSCWHRCHLFPLGSKLDELTSSGLSTCFYRAASHPGSSLRPITLAGNKPSKSSQITSYPANKHPHLSVVLIVKEQCCRSNEGAHYTGLKRTVKGNCENCVNPFGKPFKPQPFWRTCAYQLGRRRLFRQSTSGFCRSAFRH